MIVPCIAIHGIGPQIAPEKERAIKKQVEHILRDARFRDSVSVEEFNWDKLVEHSSQKPISDMIWFVEATAENISVSARLGLTDGNTIAQRFFGTLQFHLHRLCQWLIALSIGVITVGALSPIMMSIPSHFFELPVSYDSVLGWLPTALLYFSIAVLLLSVCVLAIGILRAAIALSVRPLYETIRSLVLLVLQPILVFFSGMLSIKWTSVTQPVWMFGGFLLLILMGYYVASLFTGEPFLYGTQLEYSVYVLLAAAALVLLQLILARRWFGWVVKLLLDIFRYLGDPDHRLHVQENLDNMLKDLRTKHGNKSRFILLAHSLGSVIAVDSLLTSSFWRSGDIVYLITMGSPIRRYFQLFFPNIILPASTVPLAHSAASRVGALYWINVFRPFDYVGASLGLSRHGVGVDASTGQPLKFHFHYWSDEKVRDTIENALEGLQPTPRPAAPSGTPIYSIPSPPTRSALVHLLRGATVPTAIALYIAIFVGSLLLVSSSLEVRNTELARTNTGLQSEGKVVAATVRYNRETLQIDPKSSTYIHHFTIWYTDPSTSQTEEKKFSFDEGKPFPAHRQRFDESALANHIRSHCPEPWWKIWKIFSRGIPCKAHDIDFRYLPNDPKTFDFPDFPSTDETRAEIGSWFKTAFFSLFNSGFALIPLAVAGALFMLLLGHAPYGRPAPNRDWHPRRDSNLKEPK